MHDLEVTRKRYKRLCIFRKVLYIVAIVLALVALVVSIFNLFDWNESTNWFVKLFFNGKRAPFIFAIPIALVEWRLRKVKEELSFLEECQPKEEDGDDKLCKGCFEYGK